MKKFQFTLHYTQEFNYRLLHATIGTALFFFTIYIYRQSIIFMLLPAGLSHFITTGVTEMFFAYIEFCTNISTNFCIIVLLTQLFLFFRPGLYRYEANKCFTILITIIFLINIQHFLSSNNCRYCLVGIKSTSFKGFVAFFPCNNCFAKCI